jgi:membrane fusion protein (multidrug efflux system)
MADAGVEGAPERAAAPGAPQRGLSSGRKRLAAMVMGGGGVAVVAVAVGFWLYWSVRESTDNAQIEGNIVPISARVGGTVQKVLVEDNQVVEAGTVLAVIDPADFQVARDKAEADVADARSAASAARSAVPITTTTTASQLDTARANLAAARKDVTAAAARLEETRANQDKTAADLVRAKQLVEKDEISRQQFDAAVAAEAAARATVEAARAGLAASESRVVQAEAQVRGAETGGEQIALVRAKADAAEAVAHSKEAVLAAAQLNLGYTTIRTPIAGVVSRKAVQPGQVVQPGQPLCAIVPLERIWIVANFKEGQLRRMRPGQEARVYVDAYGRTYRGRVDSIGGATAAKFSLLPPENATGNFVKVVQRVPVKIVLEKDQDPEHLLRPGMSVQPTILVR